jgi:3-hydroxybutyryl-CoA dehydrogenase
VKTLHKISGSADVMNVTAGPLDRIAVVGAGTMGRGIAYLFASHGRPTVLYNRGEATLQAARSYIAGDLDKRVGQGKLSEQERAGVLANLAFSTDLQSIANADLVVESIAEQEASKVALLADIASTVRRDTIIATNTSSLSVNKLAAAVAHNDRFIGLHFFNPAQLMKLVEIIPSFFTGADATERCRRLMVAIGKKSVVCKATPGFIVNRMARPYYLEGFRLLEENVAGAEQIDRALKAAGRFRMGPLELTDFIGQDVNYQVSTQIWQDLQYDARYTPVYLQRSLVDAGLLGRKNGRSYFDRAQPDQRQPEAGDAEGEATSLPIYGAQQLLFDMRNDPIEEEVASLEIYGAHPLFDLLERKARTRWPELRTERHAAPLGLGPHLLVNGRFIVKPSDGRTANLLSALGGRSAFVVDAALDYAAVSYLTAAHNAQATEQDKELFLALLNTAIEQVEFIKDTPGLIAARVLCSLINESVVMVESGICSREDIDLAATAGVNYAAGIFDWLKSLGRDVVRSTLTNLAQQLHPDRYRPHYSLQRETGPLKLAAA